jgi:RHS repeat-associated protein
VGYYPELLALNDYYPFGMLMPDRNPAAGNGYRFGFNGQEKTDEVYGKGNLNTALFWEYDTRIARRWNVDPVDQVNVSNYAIMRNNPIYNIDPMGNESKKHSSVTMEEWKSRSFDVESDDMLLDEVEVKAERAGASQFDNMNSKDRVDLALAMAINGDQSGSGNPYEYLNHHNSMKAASQLKGQMAYNAMMAPYYAETRSQMGQFGLMLVGTGVSIGALAVGGSAAALYQTGSYLFRARAGSALADVAMQLSVGQAKDYNLMASASAFFIGNPFASAIPGNVMTISYNSMVAGTQPVFKPYNSQMAKNIALGTVGNAFGNKLGSLTRGGSLSLGIGHSGFKEFGGQYFGHLHTTIIDNETNKKE